MNILIEKLDLDVKYIRNNLNYLELNNGNILRMINPTTTYLRDSCNPNSRKWIIYDEFAYTKNQYEIFNTIKALHGQCELNTTIISTQNGLDPFFMPFYIAAGKMKDWNRINAQWLFSENLDQSIIKMRETLSDSQFERMFGGKFIIDNLEKIDVEGLLHTINGFLPLDTKITLRDVLEIFDSKLIKINKTTKKPIFIPTMDPELFGWLRNKLV